MEKTLEELLSEMTTGVAGKPPREGIEVVFNVTLKLKDFALSYPFTDDAEKISLYKVYKPLLVSELYYQLQLYRLESERPEPLRQQKAFLRKKLQWVTDWFDEHEDFCKYERSGETNRDAEFYLPGYEDKIYTPLFSFDRDPAFCTAKGQDAALLLANRRLLAEYEKQLGALKKGGGSFFRLPKLQWTLKAIDLVELMYGLYLAGAVKAELKDMAETFQHIFDVKLDNYSYTFTQSIRFRKSGSIRLLREMLEAVLAKLDELDGK